LGSIFFVITLEILVDFGFVQYWLMIYITFYSISLYLRRASVEHKSGISDVAPVICAFLSLFGSDLTG
jgi:hypothetical protein